MKDKVYRLFNCFALVLILHSFAGCTDNSQYWTVHVGNDCKTQTIAIEVDGKIKSDVLPNSEKAEKVKPGALVRLLLKSSQKEIYKFTMEPFKPLDFNGDKKWAEKHVKFQNHTKVSISEESCQSGAAGLREIYQTFDVAN